MTRAVFISYAHEDTEAARRIAEALRGAGLEVWFDQNELRGGDAWDQKIRRQIDGCALFIPIVSAHTQTRAKGYFRLEWKLAVEQTHLMAEGVPYLAPVAIDSTSEKAALVPPEFLKVQWSRLAGGEPTPAFVVQVQRLLGPTGNLATTTPDSESTATRVTQSAREPAVPSSATSRTRRWLALAGLTAVGAVAAFYSLRPSAPPAPSAPSAASPTKEAANGKAAPAAPAPAAERRVAVLGFSYLSDDRSKEYYADAVREVLLTALGKVPGLQVVSFATSTRDTPDPELARKAGADYLVKGAVQALGDRIRISARLVRGADGVELWSDNFTRELRDFITVQDQIAALVANHLSLKLGSRPAAAPVHPAAFQLYLEGRQEWNKRSPEGFDLAQQKFEQAIAFDSKFARAYSGLADVWYQRRSVEYSGSPDGGAPQAESLLSKDFLAEAREYVEKALSLDDSLAEAHASLAQILRDPPAKEASYRRALELNPSYPSARHWYGMFLISEGRLEESVNQLAVAERLDPLSHRIASAHGLILVHLRRWSDAVAAAERSRAIDPTFVSNQLHLAHALIGLGKKSEALSILRNLPEMASSGIALRALAGDRAIAETLARRLFEKPGRVTAGRLFEVYAALNWVDEGFRFLEKDGVHLTNSNYVLYTEMTFDSVRNDPRFEAALTRFGLLEKYRSAWAASAAGRKAGGQR